RAGGDEVGLDLDRWRARMAGDLTALFLVAQALQPDLERAAEAGGAAVLAATMLGGAFGCDPTSPVGRPGQGGVAGFVKTLAQEWPAVRAKVVDLAPDAPAPIAACLLAELLAGDGLVEVGYRDGR